MKTSKIGNFFVTLQRISLKNSLYAKINKGIMNLSKNWNCLQFSQNVFKVTILSLFLSNSFAQITMPTTAPTTTPTTNLPTNTPPVVPPTTNNIPKTTTQQTPTNRNGNTKTGAGTRVVMGADDAEMSHEDSIAAAKQLEIEDDLRLTTYRKRIFGYNMFNKAKFEFAPQLNIATPNNYVLGANDALIIDIYGYSQATFNSIVSPDGFITIKNTGLVYVSGSTIEQAKARIIDRMSKIYVGLRGVEPNTFCNVSLGNIRSIKITVTGEVIAPGTYTVPSLATVMNALYLCGGPNEIGTYRAIEVIRQNKVVATLDLYDLLTKGFSAGNVLLHDQDIIQVKPYLSRVAISGQVKRNGLFELEKGEKIANAVFFAGGFRPEAYTHRLKIYRNTSREKKIIDVEEKNFGSFEMQTGDSIEVEKVLKRFENLVAIHGAVYRPGEYSLDNNQTLTSLIKSAEGLKGEALLGRISIVRTNENMSIENISISLEDIQKGKAPDVILKREDAITIPSMFDLTEVSYIHIQGAINNPAADDGIELPYVRNMTIEDVLVKVGGITEAASLSRVEVVRRKRNVDATSANAQISEPYYFNIRPDLKVEDAGSKFVLFPYDEIFVRKSPNYQKQTFTEVQGEVFYPAVYGIKSKEEKISDVVQRAGGLTPQAYLEGATIIRKVQLSDDEIEQRRHTITELANSQKANQQLVVEDVNKTKSESIGINMTKILANPGGNDDIILQDGDIIRIPKRLETVRIQGEVLYPTTIKYTEGAGFSNYISRSGGFTKRSLRSKAYVLYANGSVDRTRKFLFLNVFPKIAPGSEIIIPQKAANTQQQLAQTQQFISTIGGIMTGLITIYTLIKVSK